MDKKKLPDVGKRRTDKFFVFVYSLVALMFLLQVAIIAFFDIF